MGRVHGRVQLRRRLEGVLFTVSRMPPAACWRLQRQAITLDKCCDLLQQLSLMNIPT